MKLTYEQVLSRIAERTVENRELWRQSLSQRRTGNTAIYGIPFYNELTASKKFECHISILTNLEYFTTFKFKLYIANAAGTIDPDLFTFEIGDPENDDGEPSNMYDITAYLQEQHNEWVDGEGYFPTTSFGDGDEAGDFYDILDVCSLLTASGDTEARDAIASPGNKLVRITSPVACDVTWIPYLDYSMVNR